MSKLFQAKTFVNYWLDAVDDHSLHSPFFFDLYRKVIQARHSSDAFQGIEVLRNKLSSDISVIDRVDYGAGSSVSKGARTVKDIVATTLSQPSFLHLYHRLIEHYQARHVVELGTSLGISSMYLARASGVELTTFEGSPALAALARKNFQQLDFSNIKLVEGNIDTTLPNYLGLCQKIDIAFMDANHRYEPTLRYFNWLLQKTHSRSVIIMDDIHYSPEMEKAWQEIKAHRLVYGSADLYRCGLLFFDPSINRQHVILQK